MDETKGSDMSEAMKRRLDRLERNSPEHEEIFIPLHDYPGGGMRMTFGELVKIMKDIDGRSRKVVTLRRKKKRQPKKGQHENGGANATDISPA